MTDAPSTIAPDASLAELETVLGRGHVAIVADARGFYGSSPASTC
jgi:cystathionine beta-synthase